METLTPAVSSRQLKKELETAFPGVKFSVRLSRGTGYGTAYVRWTDGPTADAVEVVTARFQTETFDGMTDSMVHLKTAAPSALGMILVTRDIGEAALAASAAILRADGWESTIDGADQYDMRGAARAVCNGVPTHMAAQCHHLRRAPAVLRIVE